MRGQTNGADPTCTLDLAVVIPDSGQAYVNVHLDYGLKGGGLDANPCGDGFIDRYDRAASPSSEDFSELGFDALVDTELGDGPVGIYDCTDYLFSHAASTGTFEDSVQNLNVFKGVAGAFGGVRSSLTGDGYEDLSLTLAKASNPTAILQTATTDEDGAYVLLYKHKGKPTIYNVDLYDESGTELLSRITVELQGNGWTNVEFDSYATYEELCDIDKAFCECNGWCAAAEYGSGRESGGGGSGGGGGSCDLAPTGDSCTDDGDCCSNSCKGKQGNKTCK